MPRYLVGPVALCCVLCGIGVVEVTRLASRPRARAAVATVVAVAIAPFAVSRAIELGHQASGSKSHATEQSNLWRAVDQAQRRAPVARLHPVIEPGGLANSLAWKLDAAKLLQAAVGSWKTAC